MIDKKEIGDWGEQTAKGYLFDKGYLILEENWRWNNVEIDLIIKKDNIVIFVEVKTRKSTAFGYPEDFVDALKQEQMHAGAAEYVHFIDHDWEIRFDIVSVVYNSKEKFEIKHIEDAFFDIW